MAVRAARILAGLASVAIGTVLLFIPGPGLLLLAAGAALIAQESRAAALALDRLELRLRRALKTRRS